VCWWSSFSQSSKEDLLDAADVGSSDWSWLDEAEKLVSAVTSLLLLFKLDVGRLSSDNAADLAEGVDAHERETAR